VSCDIPRTVQDDLIIFLCDKISIPRKCYGFSDARFKSPRSCVLLSVDSKVRTPSCVPLFRYGLRFLEVTTLASCYCNRGYASGHSNLYQTTDNISPLSPHIVQ
jgi:hypothetical protein